MRTTEPLSMRQLRPLTRVLTLGLLLTVLGGCSAGEGGSPEPVAAADAGEQGAEENGVEEHGAAEQGTAEHDGGMSGGMGMKVWHKTNWDGMEIQLASGRPASHTVFQGDEWVLIEPVPEDRYHLMVVLADEVTGERIPYSSVWLTVEDQAGNLVFDERMWPMLSPNMGMHYGINLPLAERGIYNVSVQVGPPLVTRHPEYQDRWLDPFTFETAIDWEG